MAMADHRLRLRMYRGFRQVFDGFTKNLAFVFEGGLGLFLAVSTLFTLLAWSLPALVLIGAAVGFHVPARDVTLAATAFLLTVVARAVLALYLRHPLWPSVTQPLTAGVWTAIAARSLAWRHLHRRVRWRGREYDAGQARF